MATATHAEFDRAVNPSHGANVWTAKFTTAERKAMLTEDLVAGRSVSLVLSSVVALGLLGLMLIVLAGLR